MIFMLRTENLAKTFIPPRGEPIEAVRGATFQVGEGEVFGLLGPNGAGKTTLLRMLGTIITPTSGHCWVGDIRSDEAPDAVRHDIGFLSGNTKLYGRLTAAEVLRYFGKLYEMTDADIASRTDELAEMLDMTELLNQRCESLSRVILHAPKVLILDEPTMGLDIITSRVILNFILAAKQRGHCIIFSTHYMTEAELLCDRVGLIHRGEIMGVGTTEELYEKTATDNLHDTFLKMVDTRENGTS
jgi:sodium transport system ATP-binding protein